MPKVAIAFLCMLLAACGGGPEGLLKVETSAEPEPQFHPPLPPPVHPVSAVPMVLTPEITARMNAEVEDGERQPYVLFAFDSQTWLTLGQYNADVQAFIRYVMEVVKFYGHPTLNPEPELKLDTELGDEPEPDKETKPPP